MIDEKSGSSIENQLREQGLPTPYTSGLCIQGGNLLVQYSTEVSEAERVYSLPGAILRWGQRARDILRKEFDEKYGMEISVGRFIIILEDKFQRGKDRVHQINLIFEVKATTTEFAIRAFGVGLKWIDINELDRYNFQTLELRDVIFNQSIHRLKHLIGGDLKFVK